MNWSFTISPPPARAERIFTDILQETAGAGLYPAYCRRRDQKFGRFRAGAEAQAPIRSASTPALSRNPKLIGEAAKRYGDQCVVISCDAKRVGGEYHVFAKGGREDTGLDMLEWLKRAVADGAGEVVLNSIDTDGVKQGFDLEMLALVAENIHVPIIASGGAGKITDFIELFQKIPAVDAGLAASIFHFGEVKIADLKNELARVGINVRR